MYAYLSTAWKNCTGPFEVIAPVAPAAAEVQLPDGDKPKGLFGFFSSSGEKKPTENTRLISS